jgi:1-acyl-sn-glycerol-3-phosphate acyltransferase
MVGLNGSPVYDTDAFGMHVRPDALAWLGRLYLGFFGWRVQGSVSPTAQVVLIAAPHTSNWDLPFMLACGYVLGLRPQWLGKRELFRWPFGRFMRWIGGIPVDRSASHGLVAQAIDRFRSGDPLVMVVPPSGTRRRAERWKSGFYHIARGAAVPIACGFLDYGRKVGGIGPMVIPSGDVRTDMQRLRAFYADITAKYPAKVTPVRLLEEDEIPEVA